MAITIKEIQIKTTIEKRSSAQPLSEETLKKLKQDILKELGELQERETRKRKER